MLSQNREREMNGDIKVWVKQRSEEHAKKLRGLDWSKPILLQGESQTLVQSNMYNQHTRVSIQVSLQSSQRFLSPTT